MAWAATIVLTPADVGKGWSPAATSGASDDSGGTCSVATPDESDLTVTGAGASPDFRRSDQSSVSAFTTIWQTADQAQADWDRNIGLMPALLDCLGHEFEGASTKRVRVSVVSSGPIAFATAAPRAAAYRMKLLFTRTVRVKKKLRHVSSVANLDFVFLGGGRAFTLLSAFWFAKKPLTQAYEESLAGTLATRMAKDPAAASAP